MAVAMITSISQHQFFYKILENANPHAKFGISMSFGLGVCPSLPRLKSVGKIGLFCSLRKAYIKRKHSSFKTMAITAKPFQSSQYCSN